MDAQEIEALIAAFATTDLVAMELCRDGWRLRLERSAAGIAHRAEPATAEPPPAVPLRPTGPAREPAARPAGEIRAPLAGIVHLAPGPEAAPFVAVGERVEAGRVVAVVEAMKVLNEVRAERAGTVETVLVASGEEVEAGQPLLRIG